MCTNEFLNLKINGNAWARTLAPRHATDYVAGKLTQPPWPVKLNYLTFCVKNYYILMLPPLQDGSFSNLFMQIADNYNKLYFMF